jgi:hypothetical protein
MKYKNYNLTNNLKPLNEKMVLANYDEYAKLVSDAYVNAPDFDNSVVPSYRALMESTKKLYKRLQSKVKVEFVDYDPYSSRDEMTDDVKNTGILKISKLFNEHPLYSKEENLILRAVHDYYTHIIANQDFGLRGELKAYNTHARLAPPAALPALFTEVVGQVCYAIVNGDFTKQKICKLDGFDYLNVGKIDDIDIVNKQLKITEKKPYSESIGKYTTIRTFKDNVSNGELTWHRDREDRIILPINENDWYLQMDNELPVKLHINEEFFIPKNTYHRVIKGSSNLTVEVIKTNFEEEEYEIIEEGKKKKKKRDACYYKVKGRYDVWPSAYGSASLVKCRKVGAANWGNKSDESVSEVVEDKWSNNYKGSIDCNNPKGFNQRVHYQGRDKTNESRHYTKELINLAHNAITRKKGKDYAPDVHELQVWVDEYLSKNKEISEDKKTDYSKEKEKGLHGWFERQGGEGSKGWVDCNTCKKDPETGRKKCKPCGRKEGENRKYPACRPTPSACGTKGKGKSWGKKSNESILNSEKNSIFEENIKDMILYKLHEMDISGFDTPVEEPIIKPETPVKSPSPRRKRIWEVKPAVSPKPKM